MSRNRVVSRIRKHWLYQLVSDVSLVHWFIGSVFAVLGALWRAYWRSRMYRPPEWLDIMMYSLAAFGFFSIIWQLRDAWHREGRKKLVLLFPVIAMLIVAVIILKGRVSVDPAFFDLYDRYGTRLGQPVRSLDFTVKPIERVHEAWFENGVEVFHFGRSLQYHFQLFPQSETGAQWKMIKDSHFGQRNKPWADLKWLRTQKQFAACQKPLIPPWGGMAASVIEDGSKQWNFGCIERQCLIDSAKVKVQEFEHGYIIAGVRFDSTDAQAKAFVLVSDKQEGNIWWPERWDDVNETCEQLPDN